MYYLKYRPQTIAQLDVTHIRETLGTSLLSNKWAHAYLLIGNRGMGKTSTARLIAKIVNCTERKVGEEPCNKCSSCVGIMNGSSLDVVEIDAASNTSVEDVRDLREKVKLAPVAGKYKVYIIDEVHMLSTSAFNALLKTLEEPPEHVIFVLATTDPQKLPATVVSRCLVFDFGAPKEDEILRALKRVIAGEKIEIEDKALLEIAKLANGSLRDAQKILEQVALQDGKVTSELVSQVATGNEKGSTELLTSLLQKDLVASLEKLNQLMEKGIKIKDLYVNLLSDLRAILLSENNKSVKDGEDLNYVRTLIQKILDSYNYTFNSPIPQLPLELALTDVLSPFVSKVVPSVQTDAKKVETEKMEAKVDSPKIVIEESKSEGAPAPQRPVEDLSMVIIQQKWPEVLTAAKGKNQSLVAFLRAARPTSLSGDQLTLEVFYSFHKDQLSEVKNRQVLEQIVSDIMGNDLKVRFELGKKQG